MNPQTLVSQCKDKKLIFVTGKGGVGKTSISQAIAEILSEEKKKTLWVGFEDPLLPQDSLESKNDWLWYLNADGASAFAEYVSIKIPFGAMTKFLLKNKLVQHLARISPGVHEAVLIGKVWYEMRHYDYVIADLPATGHGLAMFQSLYNFKKLFNSGPLQRDAEKMLKDFSNENVCHYLIATLPEEMPLQESLELKAYLETLFPNMTPQMVVNRCFPSIQSDIPLDPEKWDSPIAESPERFIEKRSFLEQFNLKILDQASLSYVKLEQMLRPEEPNQNPLIYQLKEG